MEQPEQKNIEAASERLIANHLFNPTDKAEWVDSLIKSGLSEKDAKHAYKVAAYKYHLSRSEKKYKHNGESTIGKAVKYTGAGFLAFVVGPIMYIIFVFVLIALLGFIFGI